LSTANGLTWTQDRPTPRFARTAGVGYVALVVAFLATSLLGGAVDRGLTASVAVIVRSADASVANAEQAVLDVGGRIDMPLAIINGFRATVPGGALGALLASRAIISVTPDAPVHMQSVDPSLGYDTQDDGSLYRVGQAIGAPFAWNAGYTGRGVDVAMIDTGVVPVPELAGQVVNGPDLSVESQVDALRYLDTYGHGTNMAGIIAGRDPNLASGALPTASNFSGVAPDARVVSVKVSNYNGATDVSQVLAAIDWVVQHRNSGGLNIRVLNLSFGTDGTQDYRLDPLTYAAEVAWRSGIVVVAAAGNEGYGSVKLSDPAYDPFVIAVGADDTRGSTGSGNDVVPDFSGRGDVRKVDFVAPGRSIISLRAAGSFIDLNSPGGRVGDRFFRGSGTSQAAAMTSGAVALLLQQRPDLTPDQVKYLLLNTAAPMPQADPLAKGRGLLNIGRAISTTTPTTGYAQAFEPATGLGTLDGARGSLTLRDGTSTLTGELDIFGQAFSTASWAPRSADGTSWSGGTWMGRDLTGDGWCTSSWSVKSWQGSSWTGSSWTGSSWTGSSWTGSSWTGSSWTGSSWTGSSWTGSSWTGSSWTANTWSGNLWSSAGWGT
jgi:serine protease AprX